MASKKSSSKIKIKIPAILTVHASDLVDENNCKRYFFQHRIGPIAIVKCPSKWMDNFWKHAVDSYTICNDIADMFSTIASDMDLDKIVYYKIFIKKGVYKFNSKQQFGYYIFNRNQRIELIGETDANSSTVIKKYPGTDANRYFYCGQHLSMSKIVFSGLDLIFDTNHQFARDNHCPKQVSELYIDRCIFQGNVILQIQSIANVIVTNCIYNNSVIYIGSEDNVTTPVKLDYTISSNTFVDVHNRQCIHIPDNYNKSSTFDISGNKMIDCGVLTNLDL